MKRFMQIVAGLLSGYWLATIVKIVWWQYDMSNAEILLSLLMAVFMAYTIVFMIQPKEGVRKSE